MTPTQMKARTKQYALGAMDIVSQLPRHYVADVLGRQLVGCATSVGANYRAACRARSAPDFIAKLKIVEEEADESLYWLELIEERHLLRPETMREIKREGDEILSIIVASIKTKRKDC